MAEKRFGITPELPKGWVDIIDTNDDLTLCNIRIEYADNMIKLLNDLNDENRQLKKENKGVKEVLIDLKKIDSFWDSALLQNHIDKIANILGVDLE